MMWTQLRVQQPLPLCASWMAPSAMTRQSRPALASALLVEYRIHTTQCFPAGMTYPRKPAACCQTASSKRVSRLCRPAPVPRAASQPAVQLWIRGRLKTQVAAEAARQLQQLVGHCTRLLFDETLLAALGDVLAADDARARGRKPRPAHADSTGASLP